jgi:hypothetical protein
MSKVKKKPTGLHGGLSEEEVKFEKIMHFSGWIFLIALTLLMGTFVIFDSVLGLIELELNASTFTLMIFFGTNSAINFGLATRIKKNRDQKRILYFDWLMGEFLLSIIAIIAVAVYQW